MPTPDIFSPGWALRRKRLASFTLVELLTVIAIIAILVALVLYASNGALQLAARKRAMVEIQGMSTALDAYKNDNATYPVGNIVNTPGTSSVLLGPPAGTYPKDPANANSADYQNSSEALYQALSGQTYLNLPLVAGTKSYMSFKTSQVGNLNGPMSYVKDPWNNSYGYSTGDASKPQVNYPYNGTGLFDLWSTGGTTGKKTTDPNTWLSNWQ